MQTIWIPLCRKRYEHVITKEMRALENEEVKLLWDFPIQTDEKLEHNRPEFTIVKKRREPAL